MQIYPNTLEQHLSGNLLPVYLVSGNEPLQLQECCDAIRQAARRRGFEERLIHQADNTSFRWDDFSAESNALSLFASQRIIELRLGTKKAGKEGGAALTEYCSRCEPDGDILLVTIDQLDKASLNSQWAQSIDQIGGIIRLWPIEKQQLPQWIENRIKLAGLSIEPEALTILADRVEGNLLAAAQDIEKLKLYTADNNIITVQTVMEAVTDSARFNVYDLADTLLAGHASQSVRMLKGLHDEGTEAMAIHWVITREIHLLLDIQSSVHAGVSLSQALMQNRVWKTRQRVVETAVKRLSKKRLERAVSLLADADQSIKGIKHDDPLQLYEKIAVNLKQANR